ncbi:MAG: kinase [Dermabacter sp.]|nr:kinase [Dermabacter sp.]
MIIIRGNSGSGKSTLAAAIRAAGPRGIAIIGQDVLRREILNVGDHPETLSVPYIDLSARFALVHGLHVVIEGILHSDIYGQMLSTLRADHRGITRSYSYELDLDETLRRHRTKPLANEVPGETVASWFRESDRLPGLDEVTFDADVSPGEALERVLSDVGWSEGRPSETRTHS